MSMVGKGCKSCTWNLQNLCMGRPSHIGCNSRITPKKAEKLITTYNISYEELLNKLKNDKITS